MLISAFYCFAFFRMLLVVAGRTQAFQIVDVVFKLRKFTALLDVMHCCRRNFLAVLFALHAQIFISSQCPRPQSLPSLGRVERIVIPFLYTSR